MSSALRHAQPSAPVTNSTSPSMPAGDGRETPRMALATADRTTISPSPPSTPRLRMEPLGGRRVLLDGGWWPRSTDPVAELPGLVLAIDKLHGPVDRLVVNPNGWDSRPRRLGVAGRVLRLGYFTSQPVSLFTALCANGDRVDLLVIPPDTDRGAAEAAMLVAATTGNRVHAPHILAAVIAATAASGFHEDVWEGEGGKSRTTAAVPDLDSLRSNGARGPDCS